MSRVFFGYSVNVPHGIVALLGYQATLELDFSLELAHKSLYFSSYFVLVFSLNLKDVVCHVSINKSICVSIPQGKFLLSLYRWDMNVCDECFILYHIYNLMDYWVKVKLYYWKTTLKRNWLRPSSRMILFRCDWLDAVRTRGRSLPFESMPWSKILTDQWVDHSWILTCIIFLIIS